MNSDQTATSGDRYEVHAIGTVASPLHDIAVAPRQPDEGAPGATIRLDQAVAPAVDGITAGDRIIVVTWLHHARRDVLRVHPRGDTRRPEQGVFATRSPDRPNPIGLHEAIVAAVDGATIRVEGLEAVDGTPVIDIKPVLGPNR